MTETDASTTTRKPRHKEVHWLPLGIYPHAYRLVTKNGGVVIDMNSQLQMKYAFDSAADWLIFLSEMDNAFKFERNRYGEFEGRLPGGEHISLTPKLEFEQGFCFRLPKRNAKGTTAFQCRLIAYEGYKFRYFRPDRTAEFEYVFPSPKGMLQLASILFEDPCLDDVRVLEAAARLNRGLSLTAASRADANLLLDHGFDVYDSLR